MHQLLQSPLLRVHISPSDHLELEVRQRRITEVLTLPAKQVVRTPGTNNLTRHRITQRVDPTLGKLITGTSQRPHSRVCGNTRT